MHKQEPYNPARFGADVIPELPSEPTNPTGGDIPGRTNSLSVEESARRKAKNEIEPVVFGVSVSGIDMQTTLSAASDILAPPVGSDGPFILYPERIAIEWGSGSDPLPDRIAVLNGYAGKINLPQPVGSTFIGDSLARFLGASPPETTLRAYMRAIGAALEGKGSDHDCEMTRSCRLSYLSPGSANKLIDFEFTRGFMRLSGDGRLTLQAALFTKPTSLAPRLSDPIVYATQQIGGFTLSSTRAQIEARLGKPSVEDASLAFFDRDAFVIIKGSTPQLPAALVAQIGYQAPLTFGGAVGTRYLGDSFAPFVSAADDGTELMLLLDRILEGRTPDFDCRTLPDPCRKTNNGQILLIELAKGSFGFTASSDRTWQYVRIDQP
jgi:hypothetical protein